MFGMRKLLIPIIISFLAVSCRYSPPVPLIGDYIILSENDEYGKAAFGFYKLSESGKFYFVQYAGKTGSTPYLFEGTYRTQIKSFDIFHAYGTLVLHVDSGPENIGSLILKVGEDNSFEYYWSVDGETGIPTLDLKRSYGGGGDIPNGVGISEEEFAERYRQAEEAAGV